MRYRDAVRRGDAAAVFALLDERAQQTYGLEGVGRLLEENGRELERNADAVNAPDAAIEAVAELRYADGETALLVLEDGTFRVQSSLTLPTGSRSPAQALVEFRRALARRSYPALTRVLTDESRAALEQDLRSLVEGLEAPGTLDIRVDGDNAEVEVLGGHWVQLKREGGVWRVKDFD